jgi:hypothetical protein
VVLVTEPEAAAIHYASEERVEPGSVVAVYDLGGGTFDVAVLRKSEAGWAILGEPEGIERLGGIDFDEAVFRHVVAASGETITSLDPDDLGAKVAIARLRRDCVEAKEALSSDTAVSIPVTVGGGHHEVRLTRTEFEEMVRAPLTGTIVAMSRALRSARVAPAEVDAVLLVGGSSRVPLVSGLVGAELGRPVAIDAHPKHSVALGAATVAAQHHTARTAPPHRPDTPAAAPATDGPGNWGPPAPIPVTHLAPGSAAAESFPAVSGPRPSAGTTMPRPRAPVWLAVGTLAAVAVVAGAFALRDRGGSETPTTPSSTTITTGADPADGEPTMTTAAGTAGSEAEVPDFDADYDGTIGEGQELIDWLLARDSQEVHLDLSFADPPAETDSPPFWINCAGLPPDDEPSTAFCDAWVLHIRSDDPTDPPIPESRGRYHLEGYFLVATTSGPNQGYYSLTLDPIRAEDALG